MAPPADRVYAVCDDLLDAVVARHGGELPVRQYVAAGPPAWDCALLATWCETTRGTLGPPELAATDSHSAGGPWAMRAGIFVVTLVRCMPPAELDHAGEVLNLPTVAEESAAAEVLYTDAQRLLNALVAAYKAGELGSCHGLAFSDWRVLGPAGNLVAGELRLLVNLSAV